jgi:hypothetical protein
VNKTLVAMLGGISLFAGCGLPAEGDGASLSREEFRSMVHYEEESGLFIANGDETFRNEEELEELYLSVAYGIDRDFSQGLAVMTSSGKDVKWSATQAQNVTYCVSTKFGSRYNTVVAAMNAALSEWEAVANVNYVHVSSQDSNCTNRNGNVVFDVNPVNTTQYIARAFFPNYSRRQRNILIDDSAYGTDPDLVGVLRHELGHTLGFRHEHTRPEAGTCFEDNNWRALTPYDRASTMHYPQCNGINSWELALTNYDKQGATALYP